MAHMLKSLQYIKEKVPEPYKQALLERAVEKGITYRLKCTHCGIVEKPTGELDDKGRPITKRYKRKQLKTKFAGVERCFKVGDEMDLPAAVASFIWDKFNVSMVGGTVRHESTTDAPFDEPCFEEILIEDRTDLGPDVDLRKGGVAAQEDLLVERRGGPTDRGRRTTSDEPSDAEIADVAKSGGARPAGGSGV